MAEKVDDKVSRKAYTTASSELRKAHEAEFADLLDKAYADLGVESPRVRRARIKAEKSKAQSERLEANRLKREKRIADLEAQLASLKGDPIF